MADPFEVRMRFTSQLQHLNASTSSATKAANYALRYSEFSDDLHSCILEQLERNNMNNRANIMYFLPSLCDTAQLQQNPAYIRMMERDILRIIDLVAPDDGSGAANVKVVRKVLQQLQMKGFLQEQTVKELEECIAGRDSVPGAPSPGEGGDGGGSGGGLIHPTIKDLGGGGAGDGVSSAVGGSTPHSVSRDAQGGYFQAGIRLDKRQVEQRIEEDRERHKRAREGIWAIAQSANNLAHDAEFERLWEGTSDVDEDDYVVAREEMEERRKHLEYDDY